MVVCQVTKLREEEEGPVMGGGGETRESRSRNYFRYQPSSKKPYIILYSYQLISLCYVDGDRSGYHYITMQGVHVYSNKEDTVRYLSLCYLSGRVILPQPAAEINY